MEENKNYHKTSINWYPGHMAKTRRQITEDLSLIDVVIELLDARIPISSQNPDIAKITQGKKRIIVLNKCDLAEERENQKWVAYFQKQGIPAILTDASSGKGIENLLKEIEKVMESETEKQKQKGRIGRKIRAMILGIPNVGKSSLINRITKKSTAGVGNKPGVTRQKQWIHINDKIELLDTPGVLWPKFQTDEIAYHLAFTGTIKEDILDKLEVAYQLTKFLLENQCEKLLTRYQLSIEQIKEIQEKPQPENENIYEIMLLIGKKRGCVISGGKIDEEKTARILLDEFKNGVLGKITIETRIGDGVK